MATHISGEKHPVPPPAYADHTERILAEMHAKEQRSARNRIIAATCIYLAFCAIIIVGFWLLFHERP